MDRVIYAYGKHKGLDFTLFRPFNWIGPKQDSLFAQKEGSSRVVTKFIGEIIQGKPLTLVDGGSQRRSFTYIDDGIDALIRIIENKDQCATHKIFNIGNPDNDLSIDELATLLVSLVKTYPNYREKAEQTEIVKVVGEEYYGKGYQDVSARVPSIENAKTLLGWEPKIDVETALRKTLDYHLSHSDETLLEEVDS